MDFETRRKQNIEDNKRILREIGLLNPFNFAPRVTLKKTGIKRKAERDIPRSVKYAALEDISDDQTHRNSTAATRRRSARILGGKNSEECLQLQLELDLEEAEHETPQKKTSVNRPMVYGLIEDIEVGASWETRIECARDGVHRVTVAGIHGGADGAYSIALSGGYNDNIDMGDCFTYTGEGGRDLKGTRSNPKNLRTAPQSKDQCLSKGNLALSRSVETGQPVRVIRGYKLTSAFAPEHGYRYDGLYSVQKAWYTVGSSGFMVWKFALKRLENQAPPPWTIAEEFGVVDKTSKSPTSVKADATSVKADATSVKADATSVKADSTSVKADSTSVKADSTSVKADATSVKADATSVKADSTSVKADATSVKADASSVKADASSVKADATSVEAEMREETEDVMANKEERNNNNLDADKAPEEDDRISTGKEEVERAIAEDELGNEGEAEKENEDKTEVKGRTPDKHA